MSDDWEHSCPNIGEDECLSSNRANHPSSGSQGSLVHTSIGKIKSSFFSLPTGNVLCNNARTPRSKPKQNIHFSFLFAFIQKLTLYSFCARGHSKDSENIPFSSVAQSCLTLCDPMNYSMPGLPVHHQFPELTQTQVYQVGDAIQPSYPLLSLSPPAPNPSQHQGLSKGVNSSHEVVKVLEFQL